MDFENLHRIYVDLDALLDTRLGVLCNLDETAAEEIYAGNYRKRLSDEFGLDNKRITNEQFKKAYAARDVTALMRARPTDLNFFIKDIVEDLERRAVTGDPTLTDLALDVNIYPYKLTADEQTAIVQALVDTITSVTKISIVDIPLSKLTPNYIKAGKYSLLFIYSFNEWLFQSLQTYKERPIGQPEVTVVAPAILDSREAMKDPSLFRDNSGKYVDPFDSVTHELAYLYGIRFIDVSYFSMIGLE